MKLRMIPYMMNLWIKSLNKFSFLCCIFFLHLKNLVDYQNGGNEYLSNDDGGAFVCFDFKDKSFMATSYSIKTRSKSKNDIKIKK